LLRRRDVIDRHIGALFGKYLGYAFADSSACACDERNLTLKSHEHPRSKSCRLSAVSFQLKNIREKARAGRSHYALPYAAFRSKPVQEGAA
jgi:hypothetical protein